MSTAFWDLIHQGDTVLLAGDAHAAIEIYTDAIAQFGHESHFEKWALEHRAHAHRFNGDPHAALADWDDWLGEGDGPLSNNLEISHEFFRSNAVLALGEFDSAIELHTGLYETILGDPLHQHVVYDRKWYHPFGNQAAFVMNLNVQDCTDLLVIEPQLLPTMWLRGITKRSMRDWGGAIEDFKRATQLDPSDDHFRNWYLCALQLQAGLPSRASPHTILPHSECYRFYYEIGPDIGVVSYYVDGREEAMQYPLAQAQVIESELNTDAEWLMIERYSHKEGYSVSFWRPGWSSIS